jgi:surfactin synthase thioesterase subunit
MLPGGHFFLNDTQAQPLLLGALSRDLHQLLQRPA